MVVVPPFLFLVPAFGAIIVYLFLRMQVWSRPDAQSVASHSLWVGIVGWIASSLHGAMMAGILLSNPMGTTAPATPDQLATVLAWPVFATLAVHALGQWSYPAPKAPRRYAELTVRRIRDFLPRKLAWTTAAVFGYAAVAIACIAPLPGHTPVPPSPPSQLPSTNPNGYAGQGQHGRIPGWELATWLGGALLLLAVGTWLILFLIARRRRLETLDADDNRVLRSIATNRLLRTVATIAAGLATIAGNFAAQPAPGATWQSSWFNALGLVNMAVLLAMWWWRVPGLPSLIKVQQVTSAKTLLADPGTHGATRLTISLGAALGVVGGVPLVAGLAFTYIPVRPTAQVMLPGVLALVASLVLLTVAAGELLMARNYGNIEAPRQWPRQPVSRGLLSFAIASLLLVSLAIAFVVAGGTPPFEASTWPGALTAFGVVSLAGAAAILAVRRRRGIPEAEGDRGLDAALRAISMYRIVRTLSAFWLGLAAVLLLTSGEAWYKVFQPADEIAPLGPSPAITVGAFMMVIAGIVAVVPVRSLFRTIPRGHAARQGEHAQ